jgi:hypothetical protein
MEQVIANNTFEGFKGCKIGKFVSTETFPSLLSPDGEVILKFATVNNVGKSKGVRTFFPDVVFFDEFNEYNRKIASYSYNISNVHSNFSDTGAEKYPTIVFMGNKMSFGRDDFLTNFNFDLGIEVQIREEDRTIFLQKVYTLEEKERIDRYNNKHNKFASFYKTMKLDDYLFKGSVAYDSHFGICPALSREILGVNKPKYFLSIVIRENSTGKLGYFHVYHLS